MGPRLIFIVFSRVCFSFLNLPARLAGTRQRRVFVESHRANTACGNTVEVPARPTPWIRNLWQHRTIPALRLKHRSGICGTASALPKCSIMSGCGSRIVLRFAVSATGGAHPCSIQYYLRFWHGICRTSLAVSALRIMRYCLISSTRPHSSPTST